MKLTMDFFWLFVERFFCVEDVLDITTVIIIEIERAIMGAKIRTEIRTMRVTATGIISRNIAIHMTGE